MIFKTRSFTTFTYFIALSILLSFTYCGKKSTEPQNNSPNIPSIDSSGDTPVDESINQPVEIILRWLCTDSDGDSLFFDVYFGNQSNPPKVADSIIEHHYSPETLSYEADYYWKIVAFDSYGDSTVSPIWDFRTKNHPATFEIIYGGAAYDQLASAFELPDGNYIAFGSSNMQSDYDVLVSRISNLGAVTYSTANSMGVDDFINQAIQTSDGGYLVVGTTGFHPDGYEKDPIAAKFISNTASWEKVYFQSYDEWMFAAAECENSEFILAGKRNINLETDSSNVSIIKINASGEKTFRKIFGGTGDDEIWDMCSSDDGDFILVGRTNSFGAGDYDAYVAKIDTAGDTLWTKTFGGTGYEDISKISSIGNNEYALVGEQNADIYLAVIDGNGNLSYEKNLDWGKNEWASAVDVTNDNGFIIVGATILTDYRRDILLVKTDRSGSVIWKKTYGGPSYDYGYSVQTTSDGGFLIAGTSYSFDPNSWNAYLIKTDHNGNVFDDSKGPNKESTVESNIVPQYFNDIDKTNKFNKRRDQF